MEFTPSGENRKKKTVGRSVFLLIQHSKYSAMLSKIFRLVVKRLESMNVVTNESM